MEYVTSFERIGIEKGIEQGIRKSIVRLLNNRFGDIPEAIEEKLQSAGAEQLEQLLDEAIIATDLPAFATFADQLLTR